VDSLAAESIRTVTLLREQFHAAYAQDWPFANEPKFSTEIDILTGRKLVRMIQDVAVQRECVAEYPADWKEALKARFAPAWFLRRWPVRKSRIDMTVLYPKIAFPTYERAVKIRLWTPRSEDVLPSYTK
jgi:hypothetical protein